MHEKSKHLARQGNFPFRQVLALMQDSTRNGFPGAEQPDGVDWNAFVSHAVYHGVHAMLFEKLFERHDELPPEIHQAGHQFLKKTTAYNIFLAKEIHRLHELFEANQLPVLTFKGPVLAYTAYGSLSRRACEDLDFLIPPDRFRTVRRILEADGYRIVGRQADRNKLRAGMRMMFNRQATFIKGPSVYQLDIHTALMPPLFYYPISFQEFWDRSVSVQLGSNRVRTFSPEDNLQLLCFHGVKNRWDRLKHVLDIDYAIRKTDVNWDEVMQLAGRIRARRILFVGLWLSVELFGTEIPRNVQEEIARERTVAATGYNLLRRLSSRTSFVETTYTERARFNMSILDDTFTRFRYASLSLLRRLAGITEH